MDFIIQIDQQIFHFINSGLENAFLDTLLPWVRNKFIWAPLYLLFIAFLLFNFEKKRAFIFIAFLLVSIVISDWVSSGLIKNLVMRARPCQILDTPDQIRILVKCGTGFSFTSSHATNHFTLVLCIIICFLKWKNPISWLLLFWASIISFAQIYVGVHYPIDVIFGSLLGILIALLISTAYIKLLPAQLKIPALLSV